MRKPMSTIYRKQNQRKVSYKDVINSFAVFVAPFSPPVVLSSSTPS